MVNVKPLGFKIIAITILGLSLVGCGGPYYWYKSNLNTMKIGQTKKDLFLKYNQDSRAIPMQIRSTKKVNGELIEIGEMPMIDSRGGSNIKTYWFLFKNGKLQQWGRPDDIKNITQRYEVNVNNTSNNY